MSKNAKKIINHVASGLIIIFFIIPLFTNAQSPNPSPSVPNSSPGGSGTSQNIIITNPFNCGSANCTIIDLLKSIVNKILMPVGGVLAVLMVMYAGFLYVTAAGSDQKIKDAHQALTWAVIGAAILLGAWVISNAIAVTISQLQKP